MNKTLEEKYALIQQEIRQSTLKNLIDLVKSIMHREYINIHGPEHHFLDGAAFLVAYKNAGGEIDLDAALAELAKRTIKMPGAMCGYWGICGSVASVGAALSVLHGTGPLSDDIFYKEHMEFTSSVIAAMSKIGGPRCCKRNAFLSLITASKFVEEKYGIVMQMGQVTCDFTEFNEQCIKSRCPFYRTCS